MEARELQEDAVKAGLLPDRRGRRPPARRAAGQPAHGHAPARAAASRRSRPSCTTAPALITLVWLGRRRIAGIEPGRQIKVVGRIGVQDKAAGHVQPALRAAVTLDRPGGPGRAPRPSSRSSAPSSPRRSAAGAACSRPPSPRSPSRSSSSPPSDLRLARRRQRRRRRACCWWSGWCSARTSQFVLNSLVGIGIGACFAWRSRPRRRRRQRPGARLLPARA